MKLMDKMNCGIIYAVKLNNCGDYYDSIAAFMSKYTDTPVKHYTKSILETILSRAIAELLENLNHPSSFWFEYWHFKQAPWNRTDFEAICAALSTIAVKDEDGNYINGFRSLDEFEVEL